MRRTPLEFFAPVAKFVALLCGWWLLLLSALMTVEILGRKLFSIALPGISEVSGYTLAAVSALGYTYALVQRSHMRISLLFARLSPNAQSALNLLAFLALAGMALFCAERAFAELSDSLRSLRRSNTPLQAPIWIPQLLWFAGLALFALATTAAAIHAFKLLFTDRGRLNRLYGPQSLEEEITTEVATLEERLAHAGERP